MDFSTNFFSTAAGSYVLKVMHFLLKVMYPLFVCSGIFVLLYGLYAFIKECKVRKNENVNPLAVFFDGIFCGIIFLVRKLPYLILIFCGGLIVNSIFAFINEVDQIKVNNQRIKELKAVVKNLSRADAVALIKCTDVNHKDGGSVRKTYEFTVLSTAGDELETEVFELEGNEVFVDSIIVNFEYSEIESGKVSNIAYPYRIYSEKMKPEDGFDIKCMLNNENVPVIYYFSKPDEDGVYGIDRESYLERLKELFEIINDDTKSREAGIRSFHGSAPSCELKKGESRIIKVQGTGGIRFDENSL